MRLWGTPNQDIPANRGQIFSQQVMPPSEVNWPIATSRKNTGRPPPNRKRKYGMRNAPAKKISRVGESAVARLLDAVVRLQV